MNIIVADDEKLSVEYMLSLLRKLEPDARITGFTEADEVLEYIEKTEWILLFWTLRWTGIVESSLQKGVRKSHRI